MEGFLLIAGANLLVVVRNTPVTSGLLFVVAFQSFIKKLVVHSLNALIAVVDVQVCAASVHILCPEFAAVVVDRSFADLGTDRSLHKISLPLFPAAAGVLLLLSRVKKRILPAVLAFLMAVSLVPVSAFASTTTYDAVRTATVTITDRASTRDLDAVKLDIKDTAGKDVRSKVQITDWSNAVDPETNLVDPDKVSCKVTFSEDANYIWSISYTNKAGLSALADKDQTKSVNATTIGETPYCFTVDTKAPTGTITANTYVVGGKDPTSSPAWEALIGSENLTFGVWANDKIVITHNEGDETSPIKSKEYFVQKFGTDDKKKAPLTVDELDRITQKHF